jgi:hypothetical protein
MLLSNSSFQKDPSIGVSSQLTLIFSRTDDPGVSEVLQSLRARTVARRLGVDSESFERLSQQVKPFLSLSLFLSFIIPFVSANASALYEKRYNKPCSIFLLFPPFSINTGNLLTSGKQTEEIQNVMSEVTSQAINFFMRHTVQAHMGGFALFWNVLPLLARSASILPDCLEILGGQLSVETTPVNFLQPLL